MASPGLLVLETPMTIMLLPAGAVTIIRTVACVVPYPALQTPVQTVPAPPEQVRGHTPFARATVGALLHR